MKKLLLVLMTIGIFLWVGSAFATPTQVFLKETGVNPSSSGNFTFPGIGPIGVYYGEYDLAIDWDMGVYNYQPISGFCVENAYSSSSNGLIYELLDPSTTGYGYLEAAWILDQYILGNVSAQAGQIAVWDVVMDNDYNVTAGVFKANFNNGYTAEAQTFLTNNLNGIDISSWDDSGYKIARNPVGSNPGVDYQDYVIPVPEPATMLLLGSGLLGLAAFGRKKFFKKA